MMKRNFLYALIVLVVGVAAASGFTYTAKVDLSQYRVVESEFIYHVPSEDEISLTSEVLVPQYQLFLGKTYLGFKEALGFKESRGDYATINRFGYLGKYQFARTTLELIGVDNTDLFMQDSRLQEVAFEANTSRNKWILRRDIKRFRGRYINGVKVTESGILAAAHLAGAGNVKKYLRSGGTIGFSDAFGTSIRNYLKKFSGYDTSHVKPDRKAMVL